MTFHPQYLAQDMELAIAFRRKTTFVTNKEVMRAIKIKRSDGNS
ncbi:MAG: hypothetical protein V7K26_30555 [Nostoc sp.]